MSLPILTIGSSTASGIAAGAAFGAPGMIVGGAIGLVSGIVNAYGEQEAEEEAAAEAARNQAIAEGAANDAIARGEAAIGRMKLEAGQLRGRQRAALGAAGVAVDAGSALDIQADSAAVAEMDQLTVRANAKREAWGYRMQAIEIAKQASADVKRAEQRAFSNMLSSGSSMAGSLYRNRGAFGDGPAPKLDKGSAGFGDFVVPSYASGALS